MSVVAFPRDASTPTVAPGILNFDRIVIGVDFAPASLAAARWSTTAIARHAHATLVHVASPHLADFSNETDSRLSDDTDFRIADAFAGGLGGFAETLDVTSASTIVRMGVPSRWLDLIAERSGANLIVLGRRADSARQRVGEPNVLERVTRRTTASVLVVPEGTSALPNQVLAVVDNGPLSEAVLTASDRVARLHQIPLVLMHVVSPSSGAYRRVIDVGRRKRKRWAQSRPEGGEALAAVPRGAPAWLEGLVRSHPTARVDRIEIEVGDAARQIVSLSAALGPTLVVAGKRGEDGAPRGSVGSVTRALLKSALMPVLAVDQASAGSYGKTSQRWEVPCC